MKSQNADQISGFLVSKVFYKMSCEIFVRGREPDVQKNDDGDVGIEG